MIKGIYGIGGLSLLILVASLLAPIDPVPSQDRAAVTTKPDTAVSDAQPFDRPALVGSPAALLARPLFVKGRAAMAAASAPQQGSTRPSQRRSSKLPTLVGTLRRGNQLFAYFEGQGERGFRIGDKIAGWTIKDISEQGASLERGTTERQLRLRPEAEPEHNQGRSASGGPNDNDTLD